MIVNAFALCGSAEITEINSMNASHAGITDIIIPGAVDGEDFAFGLHGFVLATRDAGDAPDNPILTLRLRDGEGFEFRHEVLLSGWRPAAHGMEVLESHFPLQFKATRLGEYLLTAHTEASGDLAVALYPITLRAS
ncbi:hypothetical protein PP504_gp32 [Gordonia phage Dolores]|uniref:Uncharacterized protein n=2 Tax=Beenievirus TaxID=3044673 RepID=A0AAE8XAS3_9CAUD|nr:hypothetical protein PP504_gp32 [Gordonia phage Dolores]YP_010654504.1 hypothetical protein PP508_gp31 [Gordonia phage Samman98]QYC54510.1 hypothetical protein SEA_SAMMAN98_31 [Gordonia phage Samman98]UAJ16463.1 hypothetical protein SEA_DOLORES_32 [Gordonia phage Dolores]URM87975.1 hypothetical protein SEA_WINKNICK_33 [Gordonia phage WinkNick]